MGGAVFGYLRHRPGARTMRRVMISLCAGMLGVGVLDAQWTTSVKVDELTDEKTAVFRLPARSTTRGAAGVPYRPSIIFRCAGGEVADFYVNVGAYVTDQTPVHLRFDRGIALQDEWSASTDNTALFATDAQEMIDSILTHQRVIFRFTPFQESPQTTSFALSGLGAHGRVLKSHCGFSLAEALQRIRDAGKVIRADASKAALAGTTDPTLPWVSASGTDVYYRNTSVCIEILAVHRSWLRFWATEESVKASGRTRSQAPGC